jgi:hypothetical protein
MSNFDFTGPHVSAALICEKVLMEAGNIPSFIRVVDRFTIPKFTGLPAGVQLPQQVVQFSFVVILKAGDLGSGSHKLKIRFQKPDGSYVSPDQELSIFFQGGDDNGVMHTLPVGLPAPEEGLHWFEVYFEDQLLTRTPLRILFQHTFLQPPPV